VPVAPAAARGHESIFSMRSPGVLAAAAARRILSPIVPARKKLPFTLWLHKMYQRCEAELLHLDEFIAGNGTAIDIGANIGLYTCALSRRFQHVISFEVNEGITGLIRDYNPGNIELIHCGLSSAPGEARFYIPVAAGQAQEGWGSLDRNNLPGAERLIEKEVTLRTLDSFAIPSVDFIKIDVEGHEIEVLKGSAATIEESRPIVLVELKKEHVQEVDDWFAPLDYKRCRLSDFTDVREQLHYSNHIYVPLEKLARFGIPRPNITE
jgi:FkbM family methyltransferase